MSTVNGARFWKEPTIFAAIIAVLGMVFAALISAVVSLVVFYKVALPESRATTQLAVQQIRESTATAAKLEADNKQSRLPALQVTPEIRQTTSVQDIREIRFEILLENKGSRDMRIHRISSAVEDGSPKGEAAQNLVDTQNYYYERLEFANKVNSNKAPEQFVDPVPTKDFPNQPAGFNEESKNESKNHGAVLFTVGAIPTPPPQVPNYDPSRGLSKHLSQLLPAHEKCPHGHILALSSSSPDLKWTAIQNAKQSIDTPSVLHPTQAATRHFNYLLTEYPLQHNSHWLRFKITVEYSSDEVPNKHETQDYECIVSGLSGSADSQQYKLCRMMSGETIEESPRSQSVWKPAAPLMPIGTTEE